MTRQSDAAKFKTAAARANLTQAYRRMAAAMVTSESRDRLLEKAAKLEQELSAEALEPDRQPASSNPHLNRTGRTMADDKSKTDQADRSRINVNEDYELSDWSKQFGCSPEQLKEAVRAVGPMAEDVRRHLGRA